MPDINYAAVRQAVYAIVAGLLAAAVAFGWITGDEQTQIMEHVTGIFGAVGAIAMTLAASNTHPERHVPKRKAEGLPVYDGPSSATAPDVYVGKHRLET